MINFTKNIHDILFKKSAIEEFSYTTEEPRITIANAELVLKNGDVDKCIELLSRIKPGQLYYLQVYFNLLFFLIFLKI